MAEQEDGEFEDMQAEPAENAGDRSAAPRAASFGEGPEGRAARKERNLAGPRNPGFFERAAKFWRDTRAEMKRVSWPTLKEVQQTTIITVIAVIFFATYLWGVDHALAFFITQLENVVGRLFG